MKARATTTISILRGAAADDYGDQEDTERTVASRIPASLLERTRTIRRYDSTTPERVKSITGRVGSGTDVQLEDRVRDERTSTIYIVDDVIQQQGLMGHTPDIRLDLRQVG